MIRTGDWGAMPVATHRLAVRHDDGMAHCWVQDPVDGRYHVAMCGAPYAYSQDPHAKLVPSKIGVCEKCREIVERAANGVPQ